MTMIVIRAAPKERATGFAKLGARQPSKPKTKRAFTKSEARSRVDDGDTLPTDIDDFSCFSSSDRSDCFREKRSVKAPEEIEFSPYDSSSTLMSCVTTNEAEFITADDTSPSENTTNEGVETNDDSDNEARAVLMANQQREMHDMIEAIDFSKEQLSRIKEELAETLSENPSVQKVQLQHHCGVLEESVERLTAENVVLQNKRRQEEQQIQAMERQLKQKGLEFHRNEEASLLEHDILMEEWQSQLEDMIEAIHVAKRELTWIKRTIAEGAVAQQLGALDNLQDLKQRRNTLKASMSLLQLENKNLKKSCRQQERQIEGMQQRMKANSLVFVQDNKGVEEASLRRNFFTMFSYRSL